MVLRRFFPFPTHVLTHFLVVFVMEIKLNVLLRNPHLQQTFQCNEPSTFRSNDLPRDTIDLLPDNELLNNELSM